MFELNQVTKAYAGRNVFGPIQLHVPTGRTTVLIGPSGCGKSTCLRLLIGLVVPESGSILFEDTLVTAQNVRDLRRRMGYVIQDGGLFPHLTARGNITLMARYLGWERGRIDGRVRELAELTRFPSD